MAASPTLRLAVRVLVMVTLTAACVYSTCRAVRPALTYRNTWVHGDTAYWQRWLGDVCRAAEVKPRVSNFDKLTVYETRWENTDAALSVTSVDCTLTWRDMAAGPQTLTVILTNTHGPLPGYFVADIAAAVARELAFDGDAVTDLAVSPLQARVRPRITFVGGYSQPWQWSMRVVLR